MAKKLKMQVLGAVSVQTWESGRKVSVVEVQVGGCAVATARLGGHWTPDQVLMEWKRLPGRFTMTERAGELLAVAKRLAA